MAEANPDIFLGACGYVQVRVPVGDGVRFIRVWHPDVPSMVSDDVRVQVERFSGEMVVVKGELLVCQFKSNTCGPLSHSHRTFIRDGIHRECHGAMEPGQFHFAAPKQRGRRLLVASQGHLGSPFNSMDIEAYVPYGFQSHKPLTAALLTVRMSYKAQAVAYFPRGTAPDPWIKYAGLELWPFVLDVLGPEMMNEYGLMY